MRGIIYKYTNKYNNKVYIGQTTNEEKRREKWKCINSPYAGNYINRARLKYGLEAFIYEVLTEVIDNDRNVLKRTLDSLEKYYITLYKSKDERFGYNLTDGGESGNGQIVTEETRKKLSIVGKGKKKKPMSEQGKKNISKAHKGERPWAWKKVCQIDKRTGKIVKIWNSLKEVATFFGDSGVGNLVAAINHKHRHTSYRGFNWKYYEA